MPPAQEAAVFLPSLALAEGYTEELPRKQAFPSWLILFHSFKSQSKSDQKLACAKFPGPRNHLVILMFLSAFMTRARMTISPKSNTKAGSGAPAAEDWPEAEVLAALCIRAPQDNPSHTQALSLGKPLNQGHDKWNTWGSTKRRFYMKICSFSPKAFSRL